MHSKNKEMRTKNFKLYSYIYDLKGINANMYNNILKRYIIKMIPNLKKKLFYKIVYEKYL